MARHGQYSVGLLMADPPRASVCLLSIHPPPLVSTAARSLGIPCWARGPPPRTPGSLRTQPLPSRSGLRRRTWEQRAKGAGHPGRQDRSPGLRVLYRGLAIGLRVPWACVGVHRCATRGLGSSPLSSFHPCSEPSSGPGRSVFSRFPELTPDLRVASHRNFLGLQQQRTAPGVTSWVTCF